MNLKEAIELNENHSEENVRKMVEGIPFKTDEKHVLSDENIKTKILDGIYLLKGLVKRDKAHKFFSPETQSVEFHVSVSSEKKSGKAKILPWSVWMKILDIPSGKICMDISYKDHVTGNSIVVDPDGKPIVSGKGWKNIRNFFATGNSEEEKKSEKKPKEKKANKVEDKKADDPKTEEKPVEKSSEEDIALPF